MSKYTPGPWALIEEPISVTVVGHNKEVIFHESDKRLPGVLADARLIAAAPDLLEALELMVTTHDEGGWPTATITIARAAIAKAKGEQQ